MVFRQGPGACALAAAALFAVSAHAASPPGKAEGWRVTYSGLSGASYKAQISAMAQKPSTKDMASVAVNGTDVAIKRAGPVTEWLAKAAVLCDKEGRENAVVFATDRSIRQ